MPSVVVDNTFYDLVSQAEFGSNFISQNKEVVFESEGGYEHSRNAYPYRRKIFKLKWKNLKEGEINTLNEWLEEVGRNAFWFTDPTSLAPRPDTSIVPVYYYVRVKEDDFNYSVLRYDGEQLRYSASLMLREV